MTMQCQVHTACTEPVVAKVGLPAATALWACQEGLNEHQGNPRCPSQLAPNVRCDQRAGHEGLHTAWGACWTAGAGLPPHTGGTT